MHQKLRYFILFFLFQAVAWAQEPRAHTPPKYIVIDTTVPQMLPELWVYEKPMLKTNRDLRRYSRLVRDVKKTLPYAQQISEIVLNVNDTLITLGSEKEQRQYLKGMEKELFAQFEQPMKKLTLNQGMLLIKLVDRECSQTSYELVKLYRGGLTAFFWQSFARIMGANLKDEYDPQGDDYLIEYVIYMVERGLV